MLSCLFPRSVIHHGTVWAGGSNAHNTAGARSEAVVCTVGNMTRWLSKERCRCARDHPFLRARSMRMPWHAPAGLGAQAQQQQQTQALQAWHAQLAPGTRSWRARQTEDGGLAEGMDVGDKCMRVVQWVARDCICSSGEECWSSIAMLDHLIREHNENSHARPTSVGPLDPLTDGHTFLCGRHASATQSGACRSFLQGLPMQITQQYCRGRCLTCSNHSNNIRPVLTPATCQAVLLQLQSLAAIAAVIMCVQQILLQPPLQGKAYISIQYFDGRGLTRDVAHC